MFEHWDIILTQIISTFGSFASITAYQAMIDDKNKTLDEMGKAADKKVKSKVKPVIQKPARKPKSHIRAFFHRFKYLLLIFIIVVVLIFSIKIIMGITDNTVSSNASPAKSSPIEAQTPITSWPIKRSTKDRWLDEMDNLKVSAKDAFFRNEWNAFDMVTVKHQIFPHSVGVSIPQEDQKKYRSIINSGQLLHDEYVEYSLGFEYETLQFDYGIDDSSFPEGIFEHPYCQFKIIVDACNSESFYSSKQEHLFETDWLNDRCCLWRTPEMDVSGCEAVRITIKWQFFPRYDGPIALNVAIANPILRADRIEY